jgi:2-methylcitrate dehydratase PrpD
VQSGRLDGIGKILIKTIGDLSTAGSSTIMGSGRKTAPPYAALVNANMADICDYNEWLGATVAAPVVAAGELVNAKGKQFITACCLGYEATFS